VKLSRGIGRLMPHLRIGQPSRAMTTTRNTTKAIGAMINAIANTRMKK
jgi:hypothetical protein